MSTISVVVPVYNVELYIKKCIDSIIRQTYSDIDIILVDDGSTDNSGIICDKYAETDRRITVIHKANGGHNSARKAGLTVSTGEYICFIDSDDWVEPNMIEEMAENIVSTGADFVHTGTILEENGKITVDCRFTEKVVDNPRNNTQIWKELFNIDESNYINRGLARKLFRRELIEKCYSKTPDNIAYGEDFVTTSRCFIECNRVSFLKKAYYHYCIRSGSITKTAGVERIYMSALQFEELRKMFIEYNMYEYIGDLLEISCVKETIATAMLSNHISCNVPVYSFPEIELLKNKKIAIYGAGRVGYSYFKQLQSHSNIDIIDVVDRNFKSYNYDEFKVNSIEHLMQIDYDIIVVAINNEQTAHQVTESLIALGIDREKIIWKKPSYLFNFR